MFNKKFYYFDSFTTSLGREKRGNSSKEKGNYNSNTK